MSETVKAPLRRRRLRRWGALALALVALAWWPAPAAADSGEGSETQMVVPLGRAVGIKLFSDGVVVVGFSEIDTVRGSTLPARECGLKEGDIITHINSVEVDTIEEVRAVLQDLEDDTLSIRAIRGEKELCLTTQAVQCAADGDYKLGAWVRDSMAGIGTLTFVDPETGVYGALGHGIRDVDTSLLMPLEEGGLMYAEVTHVLKGEAGTPGCLRGSFEADHAVGDLAVNTGRGIFGQLTDRALLEGGQAVEVARPEEVETGPATILSNISGDEVKEYTIEITRILSAASPDGRDYTIHVTDPDLIAATGGIVQGMSGSPILQNGKLVGAVTHVMVNDPTEGYGIHASSMLSTAHEALGAL